MQARGKCRHSLTLPTPLYEMEVSGQLHTTATLPMQMSTYLLDKRLKEPNSRSGRRWEENSPLLQGIEHLYHVLPARSPVTTLPELSRLQVTSSQGIPSMKNPVCPISLFVATPCIFSKDLHKNLVLAWCIEICCGGATSRRLVIRSESLWNRSVRPCISI